MSFPANNKQQQQRENRHQGRPTPNYMEQYPKILPDIYSMSASSSPVSSSQQSSPSLPHPAELYFEDFHFGGTSKSISMSATAEYGWVVTASGLRHVFDTPNTYALNFRSPSEKIVVVAGAAAAGEMSGDAGKKTTTSTLLTADGVERMFKENKTPRRDQWAKELLPLLRRKVATNWDAFDLPSMRAWIGCYVAFTKLAKNPATTREQLIRTTMTKVPIPTREEMDAFYRPNDSSDEDEEEYEEEEEEKKKKKEKKEKLLSPSPSSKRNTRPTTATTTTTTTTATPTSTTPLPPKQPSSPPLPAAATVQTSSATPSPPPQASTTLPSQSPSPPPAAAASTNSRKRHRSPSPSPPPPAAASATLPSFPSFSPPPPPPPLQAPMADHPAQKKQHTLPDEFLTDHIVIERGVAALLKQAAVEQSRAVGRTYSVALPKGADPEMVREFVTTMRDANYTIDDADITSHAVQIKY